MRITMLETRRGSEDGFVVRRFEREQHYDVADLLARAFIGAGWAVSCSDDCHPSDEGYLLFSEPL